MGNQKEVSPKKMSTTACHDNGVQSLTPDKYENLLNYLNATKPTGDQVVTQTGSQNVAKPQGQQDKIDAEIEFTREILARVPAEHRLKIFAKIFEEYPDRVMHDKGEFERAVDNELRMERLHDTYTDSAINLDSYADNMGKGFSKLSTEHQDIVNKVVQREIKKEFEGVRNVSDPAERQKAVKEIGARVTELREQYAKPEGLIKVLTEELSSKKYELSDARSRIDDLEQAAASRATVGMNLRQ